MGCQKRENRKFVEQRIKEPFLTEELDDIARPCITKHNPVPNDYSILQ